MLPARAAGSRAPAQPFYKEKSHVVLLPARQLLRHRCAPPSQRCRPRCGSAAATGGDDATAQAVQDVPLNQQSEHQQQHQQQQQQQQQQQVAPSLMDYRAQWWPVAFTADLDKTAPQRFVLLEQPLVIWWCPDPSAPEGGAWRAFLDACPHRLVPLSEGRVNGAGRLECPYHGWEFSGQGRCERIPQGGDPSNPRACATAFPAAVRQGLLFVRPLAASAGAPPADESLIPTVPELDDPAWVAQDTFRDVPYDWSTLMENVLDASHVPFTHHKSISNRNVLGDYITRLTEPVTLDGFAGVWPTGPRGGAFGPQYGTFRAPGFMQQKIDMTEKRGAESMVIVYAVPSSPGRCRVINRNAFKFIKTKLPGKVMKIVPQWLVHIGTQVPLEDDQIFLHHGELTYTQARARGLGLGKAYYTPSQADTYVIAFRRWLDEFGGGGPWGPPSADYLSRLEPRQTHAQLLDRYEGHTVSCAQCRKALKGVQTAQRVFATAAAALGAAALLAAAAAVCCAAGAGTAAGVAGAAAATIGPAQSAASAALAAATWLAGASTAAAAGHTAAPAVAAAAMARALAFGAAAGAAWWVSSGVLGGLEVKFFRGEYPPPRNTAKD